jgi:hypothetical protein
MVGWELVSTLLESRIDVEPLAPLMAPINDLPSECFITINKMKNGPSTQEGPFLYYRLSEKMLEGLDSSKSPDVDNYQKP